jgi:hypothetical protein
MGLWAGLFLERGSGAGGTVAPPRGSKVPHRTLLARSQSISAALSASSRAPSLGNQILLKDRALHPDPSVAKLLASVSHGSRVIGGLNVRVGRQLLVGAAR